MLQFVVARPPVAGDLAWEVVGQLKAVGGSLQMRQWSLALAATATEGHDLVDQFPNGPQGCRACAIG
jgi:hypothetical protein